jgi:hypothetical protein
MYKLVWGSEGIALTLLTSARDGDDELHAQATLPLGKGHQHLLNRRRGGAQQKQKSFVPTGSRTTIPWKGYFMVPAFTRQSLTTKTRVPSNASPCAICDGVFRVSPTLHNRTN